MRRVLRWLALPFLLLGLASAAGFAWGLVRDSGLGDGELRLDLATTGDHGQTRFRPWWPGDYRLVLQSVHHTPPFGTPFSGEIEVRVLRPDGSTAVDARDRAEDHVRPDNTSFSLLERFRVERRGPWAWRLSARVLDGDPAFAGVHTTVRAVREGRDAGMGGLVNYALAVPAFVCLALAAALWLAGAPRR